MRKVIRVFKEVALTALFCNLLRSLYDLMPKSIKDVAITFVRRFDKAFKYRKCILDGLSVLQPVLKCI